VVCAVVLPVQSVVTTAAGVVVVVVLSIFSLKVVLVRAENSGSIPKVRDCLLLV
jgi:hypothetical protein